MTLDDTDKALVAAAHAGHHVSLLALADKKQDEGHEDFAHLLRAGVTHGSVWNSFSTNQGDSKGYVHSTWWPSPPNSRRDFGGRVFHELAFTLASPEGGRHVSVSIPTHHPEIREMAARHSGTPAPDGEHWQGENPLYLTRPDELDSLRKSHLLSPEFPPPTHVFHGRGGIFSVAASTSNPRYQQVSGYSHNGGFRQYHDRVESLDAAVAAAHRLANPEESQERLSRAAQTQSGNMRARLKLAAHILSEAGVQGTPLPVLAHDAAIGTRPDVMVASDTHIHPAVLRYLAAHHGLLNETPNVIAFNAHPSGRDRVHVIQSGLERQQAMQVLQQAGLPKFTMHKSTVYLFDEGSQLDLSPLLRGLNASSYHAIAGIGHVVGAGEGADAGDQRAHYRNAIRAAESAAESGGTEGTPSAGVKVKMSRDKPPVTYGRHVFTPHPSLVDALSKSPVSSDEVMAGLHASIPHDRHPMYHWFARSRKTPTVAHVNHSPHDTNDSSAWTTVYDELTKDRDVPGHEAIRAANEVTSRNEGTAHLREGAGFFSVRDPSGGFHEVTVDTYAPGSDRGHEQRDVEATHRLHVGQLRKKLRLSRSEASVQSRHSSDTAPPEDSINALYEHMTGAKPLTDDEILGHVSRNPATYNLFSHLADPVEVSVYPIPPVIGTPIDPEWLSTAHLLAKKGIPVPPDGGKMIAPGHTNVGWWDLQSHMLHPASGTWLAVHVQPKGGKRWSHLDSLPLHYQVKQNSLSTDSRRKTLIRRYVGKGVKLSREEVDTLREDSPRGILYDWLQENPHRLHGFASSGLTEPADHPMMQLLSSHDAVHVAKHPESNDLVVWPSHGYPHPIRGVSDLNARRVRNGLNLLGEGVFHAAEGHGGIFVARRSILNRFAVDACNHLGNRLSHDATTYHPTHEEAVAHANHLAWSTPDGK